MTKKGAFLPTNTFLNDPERILTWQAAMPDFSLSPFQKSPAIQDYLDFYHLDFSTQNPLIKQSLGFYPVEDEQIFVQYFNQESSKECVLLVHGYTDHAGLFRHVIEKLLKRGKSVFIFDFPGHGLSSGERSNIDNFDRYRKVLDSMINLLLETQKENNKSPVLNVIAQSMGAAVFMHWLLANKQTQELKTIILLAPLVRPLAWKQARWGYRLLSPFVSSIKRVYSNNSQDKSFLKFVRFQDPAQISRTPVKWVGAMLRWVKTFEQLSGDETALWIIQGTQDKTVDWQYNLAHLKKKFSRVRIRFVEGAGHHLANEAEYLREKIFSFFDEAFEHS